MENEIKKRLFDKLHKIKKDDLSNYTVVLLPDFFVDHFVYLENINDAIKKIRNIYDQKGGNIPDISQNIKQGGNAANTALALARLGINSHLICKTDKFGFYLLHYFLGRYGVNLSGVTMNGKLAITTAFEFGDKHINVMLGDTGSVVNFSFKNLQEQDLEQIASADLVAVLNWSLNKKGTDLAKDVFHFAKKQHVKTFFDTGDPGHRKTDIPDLIKRVIANKDLDIFSLNENELLQYSAQSMDESDNKIDTLQSSFQYLAEKIYARVDLHTAKFSVTTNKEIFSVPTFKVDKIFKNTGAGDTWNAGNIFAELLGLEADERLVFANCVAGYYVSSKNIIPPTLKQTINWGRKHKLNLIKNLKK